MNMFKLTENDISDLRILVELLSIRGNQEISLPIEKVRVLVETAQVALELQRLQEELMQ